MRNQKYTIAVIIIVAVLIFFSNRLVPEREESTTYFAEPTVETTYEPVVETTTEPPVQEGTAQIDALSYVSVLEDGTYTDKDNVALYLNTYAHLPKNYITKDEAKALGWQGDTTLDKVAPGMSIGGDKFGNREGLLPKESGRQYYECDIDYVKGSRNAKRIVYSNDGLIYYTEDHYNTFTLLYGEE